MRIRELRVDRVRIFAALDAADGLVDADSPSRAFVGRVVNGGAMGSGPNRYYLANPVTLAGAEVEGGAATRSAGTNTIAFDWLGPASPVVGQDYVVQLAGDRWVSGGGGTAGGTGVGIAGCACTSVPALLTMTSLAPSCAGGLFQSCSLQWGPTDPAYAALNLGAFTFLSAQSFLDANGQSFRYYLNCQFTQFTLSRVYASSIYGTPFLDIVRYSWALTDPTNTCTPLSLVSGRIYLGGDPTCNVTITAPP